jgi:hypothetical protein
MVFSLIKCTIEGCINEYIKTDWETKTSGDNTGRRTEELDQLLQKGEGQFVEF